MVHQLFINKALFMNLPECNFFVKLNAQSEIEHIFQKPLAFNRPVETYLSNGF